MPDRYSNSIHEENVRNFTRQLEAEKDEAKRRLLINLIEEEKRQLGYERNSSERA